MRVLGLTTGSLNLRSVFLEGSPLHGGSLGLIRALRRDPVTRGPFPMWVWIVETSDELVLIDTGSRSDQDGGLTRTMFAVSPAQELVPGLSRLGYRPSDFTKVVMTHLHVDHVGGLEAFPADRIWVSKAEWDPVARFPGSLMRPLTAPVPRTFRPRTFTFDGPPIHPFPASHQVTSDGTVVALPTPGHSPGHTSYLVRSPKGPILLAGDVTYSQDALERQELQGFVPNPVVERTTLAQVLLFVRDTGAAYLPSHDGRALERLAEMVGADAGNERATAGLIPSLVREKS